MKKIVSIILVSAVLITGNVAFAQAATPSPANSNITQRASDYKARLSEVAPMLQTIRNNRTEILRLRADARVAYNKAKTHIKELLKNKDNLTPDQIQSIKDALNDIKQDRQALGGTQGDIAQILPDLRAAKKDKNIEEAKNDFKSIIDVQNVRIADLKKLIDDLNRVASL